MLDLTEYKEYMTDNKDFLVMLQEKESPIYDRLADVIKVLGYVDFLVDAYEKVEEEYEVFYETGFPFFFNQLEEVKIYYKKYFNSDYSEFKNYDQLINYSLYLDDFKDTLKEEELLNEDIENAIKDIQTQIEEILTEKNGYSDEVFDKFNAILQSEIKFRRRVLTTTEVFERIVEELVL